MYKIAKSNLPALFRTIAEAKELYLPIQTAGQVNFGPWSADTDVDIETLKSVKSPKDVFFPQSETMMKFKTEGKSIEVVDVREEKKPFVLFGVRACDFKAFDVLDRVFLADPVDTYYQSRREAGVIVTLACSRPEESCFCKAFGIDAAEPMGDITAWMDENYLYWRANTEKGKALTASVSELFEEGGDKQVNKQQEKTREIIEKLPFSQLDLSRFKGENLNELFEAPEWQTLSEACLGCGACTFVCPTCQCFDIRDFKTKEGVIRYRCWDSCMYSDFTLMAAANSRTTQLQRYRQRFMHKLVYYPAQHEGLYSCVGCGRCVNKCPQRLNIVKVIKTLGGKAHD